MVGACDGNTVIIEDVSALGVSVVTTVGWKGLTVGEIVDVYEGDIEA